MAIFKYILPFLFFFFCTNKEVSAQEKELAIMAPYVIGGKWTGKIVQQKGGIAESYYYEIELSLTHNKIKGKGFIKTESMYGHFEISGSLNGSAVQLEDVRITNENIREQAAWCIKKMRLNLIFKNGVYCLEGPWSGYTQWGDCSPGKIYLKRDAIRA